MNASRRQRRMDFRCVALLLLTLPFSQSFIHVPSFMAIQFAQTKLCTLLFPLDYENFEEIEVDPSVYDGHEAIDGKPTKNLEGPDRRIQPPSFFPTLYNILTSPPISYPHELSVGILNQLNKSGFVDDNDVVNFSKGFTAREEVLSQILMQDFSWKPLDAHRARVGIIALVHQEQTQSHGNSSVLRFKGKNDSVTSSFYQTSSIEGTSLSIVPLKTSDKENDHQPSLPKSKRASWRSVLVNDKAKLRRSKTQNGQDAPSDKDTYNYGLSTSDQSTYPNLFDELEHFWEYMTVPQTSANAQPPIRERTAEVYQTHARLFLGWALAAREDNDMRDLVGPHSNDEADTSKQTDTRSAADNTISLISSSKAANPENIRREMWNRVSIRRQSTIKDKILTPDEMKIELKRHVSLIDIFPDTSTQSATSVLNYILWLRSQRNISSNYEANILRGLIKLVKFRFASTLSETDASSYSSKSKNASPLDDLPLVIELRRLHRDAGQKAKKSQRSSDEGKKWLEWDEYLEVIEMLKCDLIAMIARFEKNSTASKEKNSSSSNELTGTQNHHIDQKEEHKDAIKKKEIATIFQHYLILSFFASVPDRQRTFRELELGRSFLRIDGETSISSNNHAAPSAGDGIWVIKHTADDYKTGATYGERPPLPLSVSLTPFIDDFLERWRPSLLSDTNLSSSFLFLQPRTGNPLTPNSIYQIVSRCCYKYKQKKTNPHLLRDMIVTHIRKNADASEKELEALALFMGHSVSMQRESYDRRTLEQKIEPAIQMMQQMMMTDVRLFGKKSQ
ncbi:hypothetical protein ACHAW6_011908 [Cyclotella cf. meneghiniana]